MSPLWGPLARHPEGAEAEGGGPLRGSCSVEPGQTYGHVSTSSEMADPRCAQNMHRRLSCHSPRETLQTAGRPFPESGWACVQPLTCPGVPTAHCQALGPSWLACVMALLALFVGRRPIVRPQGCTASLMFCDALSMAAESAHPSLKRVSKSIHRMRT